MSWQVRMVDKSQKQLGLFTATENQIQCAAMNAKGLGILYWLDLTPGLYTTGGEVVELQVFKNSRLFAIYGIIPVEKVHPGDIENRPCVISQVAIDAVAKMKTITGCDSAAPDVVRINDYVCTCGGWSCYGKDVFIHSFDCDLRK
jgi:hypothetical protein